MVHCADVTGLHIKAENKPVRVLPGTDLIWRLARVLLMLAHFGKDGVPETVIPKISQGEPSGNDWHDPLASEVFS
jgi:hypothetical protein